MGLYVIEPKRIMTITKKKSSKPSQILDDSGTDFFRTEAYDVVVLSIHTAAEPQPTRIIRKPGSDEENFLFYGLP